MIVLVEDQPDQRQALKMALQMEGYAVRVARNGHEALALMAERPSRVVITDIFMPDMDGLELIAQIREQFPETKIISVSGGARHSQVDYLESSRLLGVHAALQKPFEVKDLLALVRELIGRP
jgi:two-component system response regulator AtoC